MTIPSGTGTEVPKMLTQAITGALTLTPDDVHIWIILNIIVKNNHSASTHFDIKISDDNGSAYQFILESQTLDQDKTFVWNDRIVLVDNTNKLMIDTNASDPLHVTVNYIEQDWS